MGAPTGMSKYLNSNGNRLTRGLFIEWDSNYDSRMAIYSLGKEDKEVDGKVYPSLYRLYMELGDLGEGEFVEKYMYDKRHWEMVCESVLKNEIPHWRDELRQRQFSKMLEVLERDALDPESNTSTSSAKFLIEKIYRRVPPAKVGRPSSKQDSNSGDSPNVTGDFMEDAKRLKLVVNRANKSTGGK